MKFTSILFGLALLLSNVHVTKLYAAEVSDKPDGDSLKINRNYHSVMSQREVPSFFQAIGTSLFDNNQPIYLDKRSIKRVSNNSYVYTTVIGIDNRKSETDYIVHCDDISNVRLLRSRSYNANEKVSNIELVDKLVSADFQGVGDSDRYHANQIICSQS